MVAMSRSTLAALRSILFRDPDGNLVNLFTPVTEEAIKKFNR